MDSMKKEECGSCEKPAMCGCMCHKACGALLVVGGLAFLAQAMTWLTPMTVSYIWPVLVILAGLMKMMDGKCKCCKR